MSDEFCVGCEREADALKADLAAKDAEIARLTQERDRYENAQCVTCGRNLDRLSPPTPETEER